jgi:hypothetical protein
LFGLVLEAVQARGAARVARARSARTAHAAHTVQSAASVVAFHIKLRSQTIDSSKSEKGILVMTPRTTPPACAH